MHVFNICDVRAIIIDSHALGYHVFGLVGDQTVYVARLFALKHNIANVVHYLVSPSISQPPLHSLEPLAPRVVCKFGLNLNRLSS